MQDVSVWVLIFLAILLDTPHNCSFKLVDATQPTDSFNRQLRSSPLKGDVRRCSLRRKRIYERSVASVVSMFVPKRIVVVGLRAPLGARGTSHFTTDT